MSDPITSPSTERIRLHSRAGKPVLCLITGFYVLGAIGQVLSMLKHEVNPVVSSIVLVLIGLTIVKAWDLYQRVYMTREGIELTRPPRVIPWARVGDAFHAPLAGPLLRICRIGVLDAENWDLRFFGRTDFERVLGAGRPKRPSPGTR
jgi:hypothetical protein